MTCYIPNTRQERIADTIQFFPQKIKFPTLSLNEHLVYALDKIATILNSKKFKTINNTLNLDENTINALQFLTKLLQNMDPMESMSPSDKSSSTASSDPVTPPMQTAPSKIPRTPTIPTLPAMPAFNVTTSTSLAPNSNTELPRVHFQRKL